MVPGGAALPAGHDGARDELGHADRLDHRPRRAADRALAPRGRALAARHRRAPTDYDAEHVLLRTVRCVNGEVQVTLDCEPVVRLRPPAAARGRTPDGGYHQGAARGRRRRPRAHASPPTCSIGFEGPRAMARTLIKEGEHAVLRAVVERARAAAHLRRGVQAAGVDRAPLAALAGPRRLPGPSVAIAPRAQRAHAQGPDVRADRRARRGRHDVAARDAGRRAQLGLPLHAGSATRRSRCGACTRSASTGRRDDFFCVHRRRRRARRRAAGHVRRRRRARARPSRCSTTCTATRARGRSASATPPTSQRQHDVWGAVLDSVYLHTSRATASTSGSGRSSSARSRRRSTHWREPDRGIWEVRGEPKHFTSRS